MATASASVSASAAPTLPEFMRPELYRRFPRVHDPSTIVRCKEEYWIFTTGQGVMSRHSHDLATWTAGPAVFSNPPDWVQQIVPGHKGYFWAPDVILLNGRYLLFYSVSAWGKRTSAIALATSPTLDPTDPAYHWTDEGVVVRSTENDDFNAIDPSVLLDREGRLWLAFGSFWSGIKLVELDPKTGKRRAPDSQSSRIFSLAHHKEIEASCIAQHDGWFYLFVDWGLCCRGMQSTYQIRLGRSKQAAGPYLDRDGKDMLRDGGSVFLQSDGRFIGPGHAGIFHDGINDWLSYHFYDGERRGAATLAVRELRWDADGWPVPGKIVSPSESSAPSEKSSSNSSPSPSVTR